MAKPKKSGRLSVFKGREAKLNRAVFQILATNGSLTIYEISKEIKALPHFKYTKYTNVNRRVRALEKSRYLEKTGTRKTRAGFLSSVYELSARAYAALAFDEIGMDVFIENAEENEILQILAAFSSLI